MSNLVHLQIVIFLTFQVVLAQQQQAGHQPALDRAFINLLNQDSAGNHQELDSSLERVDKLASAAGDPYWHLQAQPQDWSYQQVAPSMRYQRSLSGHPLNGEPLGSEVNYQRLTGLYAPDSGYFSMGPQSAGPLVGLDGTESANSHNYHALVDEFKQYSRMANPTRESRAFKPKLMSTARGFGKRSQQNFKLTPNLFASSNSNGKSNGDELR